MTDKLLNLMACIEDSLSVYDSSVAPMRDEDYDYIVTVEQKFDGDSRIPAWDLSDVQEMSSEFERFEMRTSVSKGGPDVFADGVFRHWLELRVKE